jgi:N-methylhydantoinase A
MRVRGQAHQLDVPLPDGPIDGAVSVMSARFRERYRTEYGVDTSGALQVVSVRVRVVRVVDKHAPTPGAAVAGSTRPAPAGERPAHFPERNGFVTTPVFDWPRLEPGATITGPAIIEGPDSTIVVLPDRTASVDRWRNVVLAR